MIRLTKEWAEVRADLFHVRGRKCERCNETTGLNVHHLNYDNWMNEEPGDLIILCKYHHAFEHGIVSKKRKKKKKVKAKKKRNSKKKPIIKKPQKHVMSAEETKMKNFVNDLVSNGVDVYEAI